MNRNYLKSTKDLLGMLGTVSFSFSTIAHANSKRDLSNSLIFDQNPKLEVIDTRVASQKPLDISFLPPYEPFVKEIKVVKEVKVAEVSKPVEVALPTPAVTQPTPVVAQQTPIVAQPALPSPEAAPVTIPTFVEMKLGLRTQFEKGNLFVFKEDSLTPEGSAYPISDAEVTWLGPDSEIKTLSNKKGVARFPAGKIYSARFLVKAKGFIPAIGYARNGKVTPVALYSEERLAPVLKSLKTTPKPGKTLLFGKILTSKGLPVEGVKIETSDSNKDIFYSMGEWSLFMPHLNQTGKSGDFFVANINSGFEYLLPTAVNAEPSKQELASAAFDFGQVGPVVSVTLIEDHTFDQPTKIRDGGSMEFTESLFAHAFTWGQSDKYISDSEGNLELKGLREKPTPDLIEIRSPGYRNAFLSPIANEPKIIPEFLPLFTEFQLSNLFDSVREYTNLDLGLILGNLRPEFFTEPYEVHVVDSLGRKQNLFKVFYFDEYNKIQPRQNSTDSYTQNFGIPNLAPGEWQLQIVNAKTKNVVATQVVRTNLKSVSYVQF